MPLTTVASEQAPCNGLMPDTSCSLPWRSSLWWSRHRSASGAFWEAWVSCSRCLVGISGAPVRSLVLRWAGFALVVGFLAVMVAPGLPARASHGLVTVILSIVVKNSLAFLMMLVLATVTSWLDLLQAMRRLGVPRVLVATLQFMERYLHVLGEELARMSQARRARSFQGGSILSWRLLTGMLGMLLLRSFERAERVHSAMLARGWDGTIHHLD